MASSTVYRLAAPAVFALYFFILTISYYIFEGYTIKYPSKNAFQIRNSTVNSWEAPTNADERSPCPGLNILANHGKIILIFGYINRSGRNITLPDIISSTKKVFGFEDDVTFKMLDDLADIIGILNSNGNLNLSALSKHNYLEHDASIVHDDYYFGDVSKPNLEKLSQLNQMKLYSEKNNLTFEIPDHPVPLASFNQYMKMVLLMLVAGDGTKASTQKISSILGKEALPLDYTNTNSPKINSELVSLLLNKVKTCVESKLISTVSIRSKISTEELTARDDAILKMKENVETGPMFIRITNKTGQKWYMGQGPQNNDWYNNIAQKGKRNIIARTNIANDKSLVLLRQINSMPVDTFEDIINVYSELSETIPLPRSLRNDWSFDETFGEYRLTYGGYSLKRESTNFLNLSNELAISVAGDSIDTLLQQQRLFKVDYSTVGKYSKTIIGVDNPYGQYIPSVYAQFYVTKHNKFMPLAIKIIETGLIYTPKDTKNDWMFAKLAFGCSEGVFLPVEHFVVNHMIFQGLQSELLRTVSMDHPVSRLLNHHFRDNIGNVLFGVDSLLQNGMLLDIIFGSGGVGAAMFIEDRIKNYNFSDQRFDKIFDESGTASLPGYKYRDDIMAIYMAMESFVRGFLNNCYHTDESLKEDIEIQRWASASADSTRGGFLGFPERFDSIPQLAKVLANIIVALTAQHNVLNGMSTWEGQLLPAMSRAFYSPLPASKGIVANPRNFLAPSLELIKYDIELLLNFRIPISKVSSIGYSYGNELGKDADEPLKILQKQMDLLSKEISKREATETRPFTVLDPQNIPYKVWI